MGKGNSTTDNFFAVQKEKSRVKTLIVTEFFKAYFPIINATFRRDIWYIDLFCGPGRYEDGSASTPIALLDVIDAFKDDAVRMRLKIVFNDHNKNYIERLQQYIQMHPVLPRLKYQPQILNLKASEVDLSAYTRGNNPIFSFVDPWGYKDVSISQVWNLVKNQGSDCVLFFNSDRILQDISKPANTQDFQQIFGDLFEDAKAIQIDSTMSQRKKAEAFLTLFSKNLYLTVQKEYGKKFKVFVLPFYVEADDKEKTSHYIVFISKAHKAIQEMRRVMIKHGNSISAELGYDSKDEMQIALLNRNDDSTDSIIQTIRTVFSKYPSCYNTKYTVASLSELMDRYEMSTIYKVLPYSLQEMKSAIQALHLSGCINVIVPEGRRIRDPITFNREFFITRKIEEYNHVRKN